MAQKAQPPHRGGGDVMCSEAELVQPVSPLLTFFTFISRDCAHTYDEKWPRWIVSELGRYISGDPRHQIRESRNVNQASRPKLHRQFLLEDPARVVARHRLRRRWRRVLVGTILLTVVGVVARGVASDVMAARGYAAVMKDDLDRLVSAQRAYFAENGRYATQGELGPSFVPSQGVLVRVRANQSTNWTATARHVRTTMACTLSGDVGGTVPQVRCR